MIEIRNTFLLCIASLLLCFSVAAQEVLFPLHSNQAIKKYLKEHPKAKTIANQRTESVGDTIQLPFIDDFSYDGVYPNPNLWSDSNVFINRDYPIDPPTIGVATFDGLDKFGNPYDSLGTTDGIADHLTSRYINLDTTYTDTTIWLSFFYQPQGLGTEPKPGDSLMVEFENPEDQTWIKEWSVPGEPDTAFQQVMINVRNDSLYTFISGGFRFRFTNIANLNGNVDHWHIDYVRLERNRSAIDTGFAHDGAFLYRNKALLVPPYTSMPYSHFKTNSKQLIVKSDTVLYKNLSGGPAYNFANDFRIVIDGNIYYDSGDNAINVNAYSTGENIKALSDDSLPVTPQSSLEFTTWNINKTPDDNHQNDTVREPQILSNYYSYDDGTAEAAYGLNGAIQGVASSLALRFDLIMPDTLRGVKIYWNWLGPDVHSYLCNIAVWDQLTPNTNNSHLLYQKVDQQPQNIDSINGFATYVFDSALVVHGTIYVGWIQIEETDLLNVGFDRNTDTHNLLYYNVLYTWTQATDSGTVMIRPLFGGPINVGVHEIAKTDFTSSVFPNPSSHSVHITVNAKYPSSYSFQLFDALGKLVRQQRETTLDVSTVEDGFYLLKITDDKTSQFDTHKIFIRH